MAQPLWVEPPIHPGELQKGLGLGGEGKIFPIVGVIEGLYPDPVPGQKEPLSLIVPEGEGEHPVEPLKTPLTHLLIEVDNDLCVGSGAEAMALPLQLPLELREVVYLAVEDDLNRPVLVPYGLGTGNQVYDAQAPVPETHPRGDKDSLLVRSPVR